MFIQKEVQKSCLRAIVKYDSLAEQVLPVQLLKKGTTERKNQ
jgi:hypothetical protein